VCGSPNASDIRRFNLMFRASLGSVDPIENIVKAIEGKGLRGDELKKAIEEAMKETAVYLRPETAQAMFVNFLNVQQAARLKPPFGIAQQGKSFRNEITVEHFTFRSCEFEQMEMEFFVPPPQYVSPGDKTDMEWFDYWCSERLDWYVRLGIRKEKLRLRAHEPSELAHYAKACKDVEYEYPWGWGELEGIAHRTDYDLKQHEKHSGKKLTYFDPEKKVHYHPFVIEPAAGADRTALAFLLDAYTEEPPSEMRKEGRVLLKLHPRLAPIKVAVFPLVRKDGMPETARKVVAAFWQAGVNAFYDEKDAVGRRYARQDEAGTPYCLTVDGQTAQDETVTIRERDSMKQERIKIAEAVKVVEQRLAVMQPCPSGAGMPDG
jgi:glycyl-tRNA synthetase